MDANNSQPTTEQPSPQTPQPPPLAKMHSYSGFTKSKLPLFLLLVGILTSIFSLIYLFSTLLPQIHEYNTWYVKPLMLYVSYGIIPFVIILPLVVIIYGIVLSIKQRNYVQLSTASKKLGIILLLLGLIFFVYLTTTTVQHLSSRAAPVINPYSLNP